MQKGRQLLTVFSFVLVTILLVSLILQGKNEAKATPRSITQAAYTKVKRIITKAPILTIILTPSPSIFIPTATQIPKKITPTQQPKSETIAQTTSPTDYILQKVNEYRASVGLSKVSANSETCNFAKIRAEEIASLENFNHNGFIKRVNEKTLSYSGYSEVTENIAYNTDFTDVVIKWIASSGHAENMRKGTQYVCIGKYGDYYTYEGWQP